MGRLARAELGTGEFLTLDTSLARFEAVTGDEIRSIAATIAAQPLVRVAVGDVSRSTLTP